MTTLRNPIHALALLALANAFTAPSHACVEGGCVFKPAFRLPTEEALRVVATSDLNNDGRIDIVGVGQQGDYSVHVFFQGADGKLQQPQSYYPGEGDTAWPEGNSVDVGDLNGDGRNDIALTTTQGLRVMVQDDQSRFDTYTDYTTPTDYKLRLGDFNQDGRLDLAAIGWSDDGANVYFQNAAGTLDAPVHYAVGYGGWNDLTTGDLNSDGLTDLVVMSGQGIEDDDISLLLQAPTGGLQAPVAYNLPSGNNAAGVAAGDVTGDGRDDLVVTDRSALKIAVFAQNLAGTLEPPVLYTSGVSGRWPYGAEIADMNNDGRGDVVVLAAYGALHTHLQNADGTLAPYIIDGWGYASSNVDPHGLSLTDLDGDGQQDAVVGSGLYLVGVNVHYRVAAHLRVTLVADKADALVGERIHYTATIVNEGPDAATHTRFAQTRPLGMFDEGFLASSQGTCDDLKKTCELGALDVGDSATVTFTAYAYDQPGDYTNSVTVSAFPYDGDTANNTATVTNAITPSADLEINTHEVSGSSNEITYTVYVSNDGNTDAQGVVITDTLPAGITPTSATWAEWAGTRTGTCQIAGQEVSCDIGPLPVTDVFAGGFPIVVTLRGLINTTENLLNVARVTAATGDPDLSDNTSSRLSDAQGNAINQPPVIALAGPYTARLGASLVMDARATRDPENERLSFTWNFPDGSQGWDRQGRHTFLTLGPVPVTLTVTDDSNGVSVETFDVNAVNTAPVADAGAPYHLQRKTNQVLFDATRSFDVDGSALDYFWDFGDGATGTGSEPVHAYALSGEYTAGLTVNDGAAYTVATTTVVVLNAVPIAKPGGPYDNQKNQPVTFDGSGSIDGDGDPLAFFWDFGDGNGGSGTTPTHTYAQGGTYTATLIVNDGETDSAPATTTVTVVNHAPVADGGGPYEAVKGQPATLDGSASYDADGDLLTYRWDFGDGSIGSGATPTHVYAKNGRYPVTLVVNDGEVDSGGYETTVRVKNR